MSTATPPNNPSGDTIESQMETAAAAKPGVGVGGPVEARPSPASVSGAVRPTCPRCNAPHSEHDQVWICPDGSAVNADGTVNLAVKARATTIVTSQYKALLDKARDDGVKFEDLPKPEENGCRNAKLIKEIDGSVYVIPADAIGVGLDIGDAVRNTALRFGWMRTGLVVVAVVIVAMVGVYSGVAPPAEVSPVPASATIPPTPPAATTDGDDQYRDLCAELYDGGDMTVAQERAFLELEGIEVEGE